MRCATSVFHAALALATPLWGQLTDPQQVAICRAGSARVVAKNANRWRLPLAGATSPSRQEAANRQ